MTNFLRQIALGAASLAMFVFSVSQAAAVEPVVIGYATSKTGSNAVVAGITTRPNYKLWVLEVNEAGGLLFPDGTRRPIEVIEYDDRSSNQVLVRAVERLVTQDKADLILAPTGTDANLVVAPLLARYGYPHLATFAISNNISEFVARWPRSFWLLGGGNDYAHEMVRILSAAHAAGDINNEVVLISAADGLGVDLARNTREILKEAGFRVTYERSYPRHVSDLSGFVRDATHLSADSFVAMTYAAGTFSVTKSAQDLGYNPKVFFVGGGGAFPVFPALTSGTVEGVFSLGGVDPDDPAIQDYFQRQETRLNAHPDYWSSVVTYASLQMLEQAIARVGLDHGALSEELANGRFDTILGAVQLSNNQLNTPWLIGQWQGGAFRAVGPREQPGTYPPVIPKPEW